jgi:DNA-binding transcriptional regulator GbsR (MarR family)
MPPSSNIRRGVTGPPTDERISQVVRLLLAKNQMSRSDLAEEIDMHPSSLSRSLADLREWKAHEVHRLALHFGVDEGVFFGGEDAFHIAQLEKLHR